MFKRVSMILAVAVGLLTCAPGYGQDYAIKIHRPSKAGNRARMVMSVEDTKDFEISRKGQVVRKGEVKTKAELEADCEILAVDEKGLPTSLTYTVRKWKGSIDGKPVTEVTEGTVIEAKAEGAGVSIRSKKGEFSEEAKRLLQEFLPDSIRGKARHAIDESCGTSERKKVGDKWPVKPAWVVKTLVDTGVVVDEKDIEGSVELQKVHEVGGVPCLRLAAAFSIGKFKSLQIAGAKAKVLKGSMKATASFDCPVDLSLPSVGGSMTGEMNAEAELDSPEGPVLMKMSASTRKTGTITPVK